ncbi:putative peptidase [Jimgerdemannia flammicorona]|uniref:Putative peptidase n=1 Tax=Jimgerdemannia flammicorona TaxID=994334 RepID=A0A433QGB1_9FUNG|nr:putative peptidase [Jimgerdemannia flammicorona]
MSSENPTTLLELHKALCLIPSVYPHELPVSTYLAEWLRSRGWTVEQQVVSTTPLRHNMYAYLGRRRETRAVLNSHLDVVPPYVEIREDEENVYGRGTCDAKGSVASQIWAAEELRAEGRARIDRLRTQFLLLDPLFGHIIHLCFNRLLYVVGEEFDHIGMIQANKLEISPEFVIVGEPTENILAKGHKGVMVFTLEATGKAAHSGYPELGKSAVEILVDVLHELKNLVLPVDPYLGANTLNLGLISGGVAVNIIPERATAKCSVRVTTDISALWELFRSVVHRYAPHVRMVEGMTFDPVRCEVVDGYEIKAMGFFTGEWGFCLDIPFFHGEHKNFLLGPGTIHVAHGENEFVRKQDLVDAVGLYKKLLGKLLDV